MNKPMKDALLSREDINVVVVAWYNGSHVAYNQAAANCRLVGVQIAHLIEVLHSEVGLAYSSVHIIGYSLGAHVAGYAGRSLRKRGHQIARITGKHYFYSKIILSLTQLSTSSQNCGLVVSCTENARATKDVKILNSIYFYSKNNRSWLSGSTFQGLSMLNCSST